MAAHTITKAPTTLVKPGAWSQKRDEIEDEFLDRIRSSPVRRIYHFGHMLDREGLSKTGQPLKPSKWSMRLSIAFVPETKAFLITVAKRDPESEDHAILFTTEHTALSPAIVAEMVRQCFEIDLRA
jgi:hypothetical protein